MKHHNLGLTLLATLAIAVGCAGNRDEIGGEAGAMGAGDGVSLQNATLSGATCVATPSKTVYESREAMAIEVVILNAEPPVAIPGWTNWTNDTTHTLRGSIRNDEVATITVSKTIAVRDQDGTSTCSFTVQILPEGVDGSAGGDSGLDGST